MKADKFKESLAYCAEFVTHCIEIDDFEVSNCDSLTVDIRVAGLSFTFFHYSINLEQSSLNQIKLSEAQIERATKNIRAVIPSDSVLKMQRLRRDIKVKEKQLKQLEDELH